MSGGVGGEEPRGSPLSRFDKPGLIYAYSGTRRMAFNHYFGENAEKKI